MLVVVQRVVGEELTEGWVSDLQQETQGGVGLQHGDEANGGGQHTDGRAVGQGRVRRGEYVAQVDVVTVFVREYGQVAFVFMHRAVHEWRTEQMAGIADEVLGLGMIGAFNNEVGRFNQHLCVIGFQVAFVGADAGARVE